MRWRQRLSDRGIATAILDRVLHLAVTLNIRGTSYRLKDKLNAGLARPEEPITETRQVGNFQLPKLGKFG